VVHVVFFFFFVTVQRYGSENVLFQQLTGLVTRFHRDSLGIAPKLERLGSESAETLGSKTRGPEHDRCRQRARRMIDRAPTQCKPGKAKKKGPADRRGRRPQCPPGHSI